MRGVLHFCAFDPCSQPIADDEPKILTEDGWMHPGCAEQAMA